MVGGCPYRACGDLARSCSAMPIGLPNHIPPHSQRAGARAAAPRPFTGAAMPKAAGPHRRLSGLQLRAGGKVRPICNSCIPKPPYHGRQCPAVQQSHLSILCGSGAWGGAVRTGCWGSWRAIEMLIICKGAWLRNRLRSLATWRTEATCSLVQGSTACRAAANAEILCCRGSVCRPHAELSSTSEPCRRTGRGAMPGRRPSCAVRCFARPAPQYPHPCQRCAACSSLSQPCGSTL
jgi:hypothetical protein